MKCPHGVPWVHPVLYCPICLKEAMRGQHCDGESDV